jgi:hypothetical protein
MIGCGFEGGNNGPKPPIQTGVLLILITASLGIYNHQKKYQLDTVLLKTSQTLLNRCNRC